MYTSLKALKQALLTSDAKISAADLVALFDFANQPEQFAQACSLLAQFYHTDIIPDEENHVSVIRFKNLFVPMPDDNDHCQLNLSEMSKDFLDNLFISPHASHRNVSLGLMLIEYIFPTQDDDFNRYLLMHMSKAVALNRDDAATKEKVLSILEFAEQYYNWDPNSLIFKSIPDFKNKLRNSLTVKPPASSACLLSSRNPSLYTANITGSILNFQKRLSAVSIFSYLNIDKEMLLAILVSLSDDHEVRNNFAEEILAFFIVQYKNNPDSLSLLHSNIIKIYLKAKEDVGMVGKQRFTENDIDILTQELHKVVLPYFNTKECFMDYLAAVAEDPRWFSITAVIQYARLQDLTICFWQSAPDNTLQCIASSAAEQITTPNTTHLLLQNNSFYELKLKTLDNQPQGVTPNNTRQLKK